MAAVCGNGMTETGEECDDNNLVSTDGCTDTCRITVGYSCIGAPSQCALIGTVVQVGLGNDHGCQRTTTGLVFCWGDNDNGQIGVGGTSTTDVSVGTAPVGLPALTEVSAGGDHVCGITGPPGNSGAGATTPAVSSVTTAPSIAALRRW